MTNVTKNVAAAPNALRFAFSTSSIPNIKNGCFMSNVPTKDFYSLDHKRGGMRYIDLEKHVELNERMGETRTINSIPVAENKA